MKNDFYSEARNKSKFLNHIPEAFSHNGAKKGPGNEVATFSFSTINRHTLIGNLSLKGLSILRKVFVFCICLLKYLYSKYEFLPVYIF